MKTTKVHTCSNVRDDRFGDQPRKQIRTSRLISYSLVLLLVAAFYPVSGMAQEDGKQQEDGKTVDVNSKLKEVDTTNAGEASFQQSSDRYIITSTGVLTKIKEQYGGLYVPDTLKSDMSVEVILERQKNPKKGAKTGLKLASNLSDGGGSTGDVVLYATPGNGYVLGWDGNGDGYMEKTKKAGVEVTYPVTLKLERAGAWFTGYYSTAGGETFTEIGTVKLTEVDDAMDVGMVHTSGHPNTASQATFSGFKVRENPPEPELLRSLQSPIVLEGDENHAYRDPTVLYHDGVFHLFCTLVETDPDGRIYSYVVHTRSRNLQDWSKPRKITPKGQKLNYSSPGNVLRHNDEWVLSLQTYPLPGYRRGDELTWANDNARIFTMRSDNLKDWSEPELLRVKGPDVPRDEMGRMIDAYLLEDKDDPGKYWCFYKQDGVSFSWSRDLNEWHYAGRANSGENACVIVDEQADEYILFHSPGNGIGMKRSTNLKTWREVGERITLGQTYWPWAETRLTAGFVIDLRHVEDVGKYVMFFHGVGPGDKRTTDNAFANCNIGIAWSENLRHWDWPVRKAGN